MALQWDNMDQFRQQMKTQAQNAQFEQLLRASQQARQQGPGQLGKKTKVEAIKQEDGSYVIPI